MNTYDARNQLKGHLRRYVESVTEKSKGANMYVCPLCNSGRGRHKTGAFSIKDGVRWKCFSCNSSGDIFDLYGAINSVPDHHGQLEGVCQMFGITIDSGKKPPREDISQNYADFFLRAHRNIKHTCYPQKRGLSNEIIERFNLGYVENWRHPKALKAPPSPRLIIPTGPESYLARDIRENIPENQRPYSKSKVGPIQLFNAQALENAQKPIFVVEGELDALSIIEVGGEAVALGTVSKCQAFMEHCTQNRPAQPLIIALDNDKAGDNASNKLINALQALNIACHRYNPSGNFKDPNEALQRNKEGFRKAVAQAHALLEAKEQEKLKDYLKNSTYHHLKDFIGKIANSVNTPYISTGFNMLDRTLDGGLYEGLYVVGAISSLGKTTLVTQIADQIAQQGHDVLIFSLEMARNEIIAKSISRHTLQRILDTGGDIRFAKTARGITTGKRYADYSFTERELISRAIKTYGKYAKHIYISEGIGDIGTAQIRQTVQEHIHCTRKTPVVIIDYIQILAPYAERASDKQNTDKSVLELKRISRDFKTPVIGISSFNRACYKEAVSMEAFKESGAIEYSSDVLIGLQLKGAGEKNFDANQAKQKDPRDVELVILKNRNGRAGVSVNFKFYPLFNYFSEGH